MRIWVSTVFILISVKTEIARSVKKTKITRAPRRRRNGEAVPRAEKIGDLITADHKVLSDNCESRNNHRYAVVVLKTATRAGEEGHEDKHDAPRRQKPPPPQPELFQLYEEEPGGSRPDRPFEVRPQEAAQRHTEEQLAGDALGCRRLTFLCR